MKFEWERIYQSHVKCMGGSNTHRSKVLGGWVVSNDLYTDVIKKGNERCISTSICFVPDVNHEWVIDD